MSPRLPALVLAALTASACARSAQPRSVGVEHVAPSPEPAPRTASATPQQNSPTYGQQHTDDPAMRSRGPSTTPAAPGQAPILNEHVAAILDAYYAGRIALAQQALWRASDPGVRHLAERLLLQHVHARDHLARLGVQRAHSDLSFGLLRKAGNDLMRLRSLEGSDYDKQWTALSIVDSQNFTHLLNATLIPAATLPMLDAQMRHLVPQFVADTRDEVRVHTNLVIPRSEQQALEREASQASPTSPARARAQGGSPRVTPPGPAPSPEEPPPARDQHKPTDPILPP